MRIDYQQLEFMHPLLRAMLKDLERETGFEFTITSQRREGDPGVHGAVPLRGTDLRCRNKIIGEAIAHWVNTHWFYDNARPELKCCLLHGEGPNLHLHMQVHPNTTNI